MPPDHMHTSNSEGEKLFKGYFKFVLFFFFKKKMLLKINILKYQLTLNTDIQCS